MRMICTSLSQVSGPFLILSDLMRETDWPLNMACARPAGEQPSSIIAYCLCYSQLWLFGYCDAGWSSMNPTPTIFPPCCGRESGYAEVSSSEAGGPCHACAPMCMPPQCRPYPHVH